MDGSVSNAAQSAEAEAEASEEKADGLAEAEDEGTAGKKPKKNKTKSKKDSDKVDKKNMPLGAKIFDIAFTVFIYLVAAAILVGAIFFAFNTSPDKALFGYRYYNILTPSMEPEYKVGDLIFVKVAKDHNVSDINVGDVITFNPSLGSDAYLTHRVTQRFDNCEGTGKVCFKTQGDANNVEDSFTIEEDRVIGKVTGKLPGFGYVIGFVRARWYLILLIIIMIAVFFQLLKRYFLIGKDDDEDDDDKKSKKKLPEPESDEVKANEDAGETASPDPAAAEAEMVSSTPDSDTVPDSTEGS